MIAAIRRTIVTSAILLLSLPISGAAALDPVRELNRARSSAAQWCVTHFNNSKLTPFVGCLNGDADVRGPATATKVPMRQFAQGGVIAQCAGGCLQDVAWYAQRKYTVFIDSKGRRRISRSTWRCFPQGTVAPLNWPGIRCFVQDPKTPR